MPFDGNQLRNVVLQHGGRKVRHSGNHGHYQMPGGVECSDPENGDAVSRLNAVRVAGACGMTLQELCAELGYQPVAGTGKPKRKAPTADRPQPTKRDALAALDELERSIRDMRADLSNGQRDPEVYRRIQTAALGLRRTLTERVS